MTPKTRAHIIIGTNPQVSVARPAGLFLPDLGRFFVAENPSDFTCLYIDSKPLRRCPDSTGQKAQTNDQCRYNHEKP